MKEAEALCEIVVKTKIMPKLEELVHRALGKDEVLFEFLNDPNSSQQDFHTSKEV